jgi:AraC-like DNA-binding protein
MRSMKNQVATRLLFRNDVPTPLGRLTMAGFIKDSAGVRGPALRVLGSYALVYILEGSGDFLDANGFTCKVQAGDALLIFPEIGHHYGPGPNETWSEFYCVFDGPVFDLWRQVGLLPTTRPVYQLHPIQEWLDKLAAAILPQTQHMTLAERVVDVSRFVVVLTEILSVNLGTHLAAERPPWIARACGLLESDLQQTCDLSEIAQRVGLTYETFRKRFQQTMGVAPGHYRTIRRIDAACALLLQSDSTIQSIAFQLGFTDEFHFSRRFKQITGVAPSEFRRQLPGMRGEVDSEQ